MCTKKTTQGPKQTNQNHVMCTQQQRTGKLNAGKEITQQQRT
jgi:hypothetical protein